ncbi:sigma-54 dependent transcriptional regulator [Pirellulaceae bacterium]|nr:sigma-54 dependent transcriptional regulator [Pirellulaceae bacterium]
MLPDSFNLLLVDDEDDFRETAFSYFKKQGFRVDTAEDGEEAINLSVNRHFDIAIVDIHMPGMSGIQLLEHLLKENPNLKAIMLTGGGTIENAVDSMKTGAFDFLTKPVKLSELKDLILRAAAQRELELENKQLRVALEQSDASHEMIGDSPQMEQVYKLIDRTSKSDKPILIQGESGTGKELVARAIHRKSPLADKPLVVVNCAALPETLLESELFGHEKGSFTGATQAKEGLFEIADGGTLFIDEFGEMTGALQAKLLRVLEDGSMRRVGSVKERHVKVRVIAATNRDLQKEVSDGRFREDLFYRINVLTIQLPPLRDRPGDKVQLAQHFSGDDWSITEPTLDVIQKYGWPGNVRQLANAIERAKILSDDGCTIESRDFPPDIMNGVVQPSHGESVHSNELDAINKVHVEATYLKFKKNKSVTAQALGVSRRSLYRLLEKYEIE